MEVPIATQIYVLPRGARFEREDAFVAAPLVEYIGTDEAYIRGLHGHMDCEIHRRIIAWLRARGVRRIRYRHKRRMREM